MIRAAPDTIDGLQVIHDRRRGSRPRVSVVMPVYNGAEHLHESLAGFAAQTFTDFELIAVDDGSSDDSLEILVAGAEADPRVSVFAHDHNQGHHVASNNAISLARGEFIARHDQDDLPLPDRLRVAVDVLEDRPEVGLVSSAYLRWLPDGSVLPRHPPTSHTGLRVALLFGNVICHASVTMRVSALAELPTWYRPVAGPQDYDLWIRLLQRTTGFGIDTPLVVYRQEAMAMSTQYAEQIEEAVAELSEDQLAQFLPREAVGPVRAIYNFSPTGDARSAVANLVTVFAAVAKHWPDLDPDEVTALRERWTARAWRSALSSKASMPRDPRLLASLARSDPVGTLSWVAREAGGWRPVRPR